MKALKLGLGLIAAAAAGLVAWRKIEKAQLEEDLWKAAEAQTSHRA